ncbi:MAG: hypothetical protein E7291_08940 [Lachnospiraceae bacterium]|nr:hypothetical protein [Lachnospiraceae bacterium]
MQRKKHKRKLNHVVIVTSDAVDASVKQFRIRPWVLQMIILLLCIVIGVLIGVLIYEGQIWDAISRSNSEKQETILQLEDEKNVLIGEKTELENQIVALNDRIQILSDTVNEKVQNESELTAQLEKQSLPTEFPLNGSASMEEITEGDPMCVFTASVGVTVVATASGTVSAVNDDGEYGHSVWVDHGNGYITIYRNQGEVIVKQGDTVAQGTTIYMIGEENTKLGYQMLKDGNYISPMDMLSISG